MRLFAQENGTPFKIRNVSNQVCSDGLERKQVRYPALPDVKPMALPLVTSKTQAFPVK